MVCTYADQMSEKYAAIQVNGEPQKRAQEISAEVAVALTLSELRPKAGGAELPSPQTQRQCIHHQQSLTSQVSHWITSDKALRLSAARFPCAGAAAQNSTQGFVQTYGVGVCGGGYAPALIREWRAWDKRNGSENDPVDVFGPEQLFVVFVVANGGADLEHFEVQSYEEARSITLQVRKTPLIGSPPCGCLTQSMPAVATEGQGASSNTTLSPQAYMESALHECHVLHCADRADGGSADDAATAQRLTLGSPAH